MSAILFVAILLLLEELVFRLAEDVRLEALEEG